MCHLCLPSQFLLRWPWKIVPSFIFFSLKIWFKKTKQKGNLLHQWFCLMRSPTLKQAQLFAWSEQFFSFESSQCSSQLWWKYYIWYPISTIRGCRSWTFGPFKGNFLFGIVCERRTRKCHRFDLYASKFRPKVENFELPIPSFQTNFTLAALAVPPTHQ